MKRTFRKYEFPNAEAANNAVAALGIDEEGNPTHNHAIVHLGHIVTTPATYDDDGNELTAGGIVRQLFSRCTLARRTRSGLERPNDLVCAYRRAYVRQFFSYCGMDSKSAKNYTRSISRA